ncbi:MAG: DUF349 domain-containing protein [Rikenellaceae bacterium]
METIDNTSSELFAGKSRAELVAQFEGLLESEPIESLRRSVEAIKMAYHKASTTEQAEQIPAEEGIDPVDSDDPTTAPNTTAPDPTDEKFKELMTLYRTRRDEHIAQMDQTRELNLKTKLLIIEELKELTESDETLDHTFTKFRELQERWRATGQIPAQNVRDVWERYHLHTENFYSVIKINRELRDLDLKRNLEAKSLLCDEAEALLSVENPVEAFQHLQPLHDQWREIGPVDAEHKEPIWQRFKSASSIINKRHLDHFESLKAEQANNLVRKSELCERVEAIVASLPTTHKEWVSSSESILEIQKEWKGIGFAPKRDNVAIYSRLRSACDAFFVAKREFYSDAKSDMEQNLESKRALCEAAEAIAAREDWKEASAELIKLQGEWKSIGTVSRRQSDQIWKRFRAACDLFFERKSTHFAGKGSSQNDNLTAKEALLAEMQAAADKGVSSIDEIKALQRKWSDIGFVPIKQKDQLTQRYKSVVDSMFDSLRGGERARNMGAFKDRVNSMRGDGGKARNERERLTMKLKQLNADIIQLENNIGFFAMSKGAESLIADVNKKIEKSRREVADVKEKIKMIDQASRE